MSLVTQISSALTSICTAIKVDRAARGDLTDLTTSTKSTIVGALNELAASIGGAGATINDAAASGTSVYSSQHVTDLIATAKAQILGLDVDAALDTLAEFQAAIGDDPSFAATTATALGNRVRFDAAQTLASGQKTQGQSNLDVYGKGDIGDPTTNFVAVVTAGLA